MGRTRRSRNRRSGKHGQTQPNQCHDNSYITFMQWAKSKGLHTRQLKLVPANFNETGRGAMAVEALRASSVMISIPESLLITTQTVLASPLKNYITKHPKLLDPLQCLCLFLSLEQHKGPTSDWYHYLQVVPQTYTNAAYWTDAELALLPPWVQPIAQEHTQNLRSSYEGLRTFLSFLPKDIQNAVTFERYKWAWSTVNTRAVYWLRPTSVYLKSTKEDCLALAPVLDLLNHSSAANIKASFNEQNRCYEIRTFTNYKRYSQAFICYGPHDNSKLLVEYGFLLPENPHNAVVFFIDDILHQCTPVNSNSAIIEWIYENELHKNISCSEDGPSWNFCIVLRYLSMDSSEWHHHKAICLLGQPIGEENEKKKTLLLQKLLHWSLGKVNSQQKENLNFNDHEKMARALCEQHSRILEKWLEAISCLP